MCEVQLALKSPMTPPHQNEYDPNYDPFLVKKLDPEGRTIHGEHDMPLDVRTNIRQMEILIEPGLVANTLFFLQESIQNNKYTLSLFLAFINGQFINSKCNASYKSFFTRILEIVALLDVVSANRLCQWQP